MNFSDTDMLMKVVKVCYALVLCFAYPMICFVARSSVDRIWFEDKPLTWIRSIIEAYILGL
jgi:hypothetical protein